MARKADTKPVTAQMYRHFAAVTIASTIALAMFASGESREANASEVSEARPAVPQGEIVRRSEAPPPRRAYTADTYDAAFGAPMDSAGSAANIGGIDPGIIEDAPLRHVPAGFTQYGVSEEVWASMTPEQRAALKARYAAQLAAAAQPERKEQMQALIAASRARSGGSSALGAVPD